MNPDSLPTLRGAKVLILDDDLHTRELLSALLADCGAEVRAVESAALAFEEVNTWNPSVIISDISMPEEDGYMFIKKIRQLENAKGTPYTPAVAFTGSTRTEDEVRALVAGFQKHIAKPVDPLELATVVASLVYAHGLGNSEDTPGSADVFL